MAGSLAAGLNVLFQYVSHFLQAAGVERKYEQRAQDPKPIPSFSRDRMKLIILYFSMEMLNCSFCSFSVLIFLVSAVGFPIREVTAEGLIFVTQWFLVALIGYWLLSLTFHLVASTLRRALWLFKVGMALACFGFILSDRSVDTETRAIRLAVLVLVCVLLGVGTSRGSSVADKTAHLEEQVKILERRLREMEKWKRTEE